jgi:uncharacterized integral membrane protein (TIGR00697 family)
MIRVNPEALISFLNMMPSLEVSLLLFLFCGIAQLFLFRIMGLSGLYLYTAVGVIAANLQALKAVYFPFYSEPIALGTEIFTSLFLCSDLINEHYGKKAALKSIWIGFSAYFLMTVFMIFTLGYTPLPASFPVGSFRLAHEHIHALFLPAPAIFISSMAAYFVSQYSDVWIYRFFYTLTQGKILWLRAIGSTLISLFIDNFIFSILAWKFLSPNPCETSTLLGTYVIGVYLFRLGVSILNTPFLYVTKIYKFNSLRRDEL